MSLLRRIPYVTLLSGPAPGFGGSEPHNVTDGHHAGQQRHRGVEGARACPASALGQQVAHSLQALEVQRGTLATLQSFGEQLGEKKASPGMDPAAEAAPGLAAFSKVFQQMNDVSQNSLMPWWQNLQSQFETIASKAVPPTASSSTAAAKAKPANKGTGKGKAGSEPA